MILISLITEMIYDGYFIFYKKANEVEIYCLGM